MENPRHALNHACHVCRDIDRQYKLIETMKARDTPVPWDLEARLDRLNLRAAAHLRAS